MFNILSDRLTALSRRLTRRGTLSAADIDSALAELHDGLLDADVALEAAKSFLQQVRVRATDKKILDSVTPGQQVIKIVHDELIALLGRDTVPLNLSGSRPVIILLAGPQGAGKTTSAAKLAHHIAHDAGRDEDHDARQKTAAKPRTRRVVLASLDLSRPAAHEQLSRLAKKSGIETMPLPDSATAADPLALAISARDWARERKAKILILDTAGRMHSDADAMDNLHRIHEHLAPQETLLVADSMTGQDALALAAGFFKKLRLTGIILTRCDGDGRGGAAVSMRHATGIPIKFLATGESMDDFLPFSAERLAGRILGHGDVVELVERARRTADAAPPAPSAKRPETKKPGRFDLNDLAEQISQMRRMGGLNALLSLLPGQGGKMGGKMGGKAAAAGLSDSRLLHYGAILTSMTPAERGGQPLNASRKRRIAAGSGVRVQDVNRLLKMHRLMADAMKKAFKQSGAGAPAFPPGMNPADLSLPSPPSNKGQFPWQ